MAITLILLCQVSPVDLARSGDSLWVADATGSQVIQVDLTAGMEIFTKHNPRDLHGETSALTGRELRALVDFVRTR